MSPIATTTQNYHDNLPKQSVNGHASKPMAFTDARLSKEPSKLLKIWDIMPTIEREKRQFDAFLQIDLAHLVMLVQQGIVQRNVGQCILPVLRKIRSERVDSLHIDAERGTLLLQIEDRIAAVTGEDIAGQLHTGRSRIDQGATARRMFKRVGLLRVLGAILQLQHSLIDLASRHGDTVMPTYTHMQQSQPGTLGHYLLGISSRLQDDFDRGTEVYARVNRNPLGAVGLSGTSWPLDRKRTTELLGFTEPIANAKVAREAFYAAEIASTLSFIMATLNDLACDLHVWSSIEFGLVSIDDSFCSTSSIFPQKRNPVGVETIKVHAGIAVNWLGTALSLFRGEGTGDQNLRSVPFLDGAFESTIGMLQLTSGIIDTLHVNEQRMKDLLDASWSTSSNLADYLVKTQHVSFREAHHVVARLVRITETEAVSRSDLKPSHLARASEETIRHRIILGQQELLDALDQSHFIRSRITAGGVGFEAFNDLLVLSKNSLASAERWVEKTQDQLRQAEVQLELAVDDILAQK